MIFDAVTSVCNSDSQRLSGDVMVSENNGDVSIALSSIVTTDSITDGSDVPRCISPALRKGAGLILLTHWLTISEQKFKKMNKL